MINTRIHYGHPLMHGTLTAEYDSLLSGDELTKLPRATRETLSANLEMLVDTVLPSFDMTFADYETTQMTDDDVWLDDDQHDRWVAEGVTFADLARRSFAGKVAARWTTEEMLEFITEDGQGGADAVAAALTRAAADVNASASGPWYVIAHPHFFLEDAGLFALVHSKRPETIAAWYTCAGINF